MRDGSTHIVRGLLYPSLVQVFLGPSSTAWHTVHAFFVSQYKEIKKTDGEMPKIQSKSRRQNYNIMEQQKIDMYLAQNSAKFPNEKFFQIREALTQLDESKSHLVLSLELKDPTNILIFSIILGHLGVDRFILGQTGLGVLKLLTCGGCYIWWIIDMVNATKMARDYNYQKLVNALTMQGISIY